MASECAGNFESQDLTKMFILYGMLLVLLSIADAFKSPILTSSNVNVRSNDLADVGQILSGNDKLRNGRSLERNKRLRLKDMQGFEALTDSFLGGTVGVMSVAFLLELRKPDILGLSQNEGVEQVTSESFLAPFPCSRHLV